MLSLYSFVMLNHGYSVFFISKRWNLEKLDKNLKNLTNFIDLNHVDKRKLQRIVEKTPKDFFEESKGLKNRIKPGLKLRINEFQIRLYV